MFACVRIYLKKKLKQQRHHYERREAYERRLYAASPGHFPSLAGAERGSLSARSLEMSDVITTLSKCVEAASDERRGARDVRLTRQDSIYDSIDDASLLRRACAAGGGASDVTACSSLNNSMPPPYDGELTGASHVLLIGSLCDKRLRFHLHVVTFGDDHACTMYMYTVRPHHNDSFRAIKFISVQVQKRKNKFPC